MKTFEMNFKTRVLFGKDIIENNNDIFKNLGKNCLIVTSGETAKLSGALDEVVINLVNNGIGYNKFTGVTENPLMSASYRIADIIETNSVDFIISIGGGSVIDAVKAAIYIIENDKKKRNSDNKYLHKKIKMVAISTTSGTGSEVGDVTVITDSEGIKRVIKSSTICPDIAIYDYRYTMSMPLSVTIASGLDAFCHASESIFNKEANDLSKLFAFKAIEYLYPCLKNIADKKYDMIDESFRANQHFGSLLAGLAIQETGTCFPHPAGYVFTEKAHLPHGVACALFEIPFLKWSFEHCKDLELVNQYLNLIGSIEELDRIFKILCKNTFKISKKLCDDFCDRVNQSSNISKTLGNCSGEIVKTIAETMFYSDDHCNEITGEWIFE